MKKLSKLFGPVPWLAIVALVLFACSKDEDINVDQNAQEITD